MQSAQRRILGIDPAERSFVLACALLVMHVMAANVLVLGTVTALFLGATDRTQLPLVYAIGALFGGALTLVLGARSKQVSRRVEVGGVYLALAVVLVLGFSLLGWQPLAVLYVLHPTAISLAMLAGVQTFSVVSDGLDAEQAKRLLPTIGAGGTIGAMLAGAALASLAPLVGARSMLLLATVVILLALRLLGALLSRHAQRLASVRPQSMSLRPRTLSLRPIESEPPSASPGAVLRDIFGSKLLRRFALTQLAIAAASTALKLELESSLQSSLAVDRIAAFLGMLNLASNAAVLTVQTVFEVRLLRTFGSHWGLATVAFVFALAGVALPFSQGLWPIAALRFTENVTRFSIMRTAEDLVLLPIASDRRRRARAFIATMLVPVAVLVASLLLSWIAHLPHLATHAFVFLAGAAALALASSLRRPYVDQLRGALRQRRITLEVLAPSEQPAAVAALVPAIGSSDAGVRLGALRTIARHRLQDEHMAIRDIDLAHELGIELEIGHRLRLLRDGVARLELPSERARSVAREIDYLTERVDESIFLLLTLSYPPSDMQRAYLAYARGDRRERAFAIEIVTQCVVTPLRRTLEPYLTPSTPDDALARAEQALGVRRTLGLDTLLDVKNPMVAARLRPLALYLATVRPANPEEERLMAQLEEILVLRTVDLFSRLSPEELQSIVEIATRHVVPAGQAVFREGDPGTAFYVVLKGELRVERKGTHVATLRGGDCFGELALLDRGLRSASVLTTTECTLSRIMDEDFRDLLERHPSIAIEMLAILARRNASLLDR